MDANVCCDCEAHSATSAHVDFAIDNNGTWSDAVQFGTPDDTTWTLDGFTFAMSVQLTYYDATPKLALTSEAGEIIIDDPVQRAIHLNVPASVIQASLPPGQYVYDLIAIDNSQTPPVRSPFLHGAVCVAQGVTAVPGGGLTDWSSEALAAELARRNANPAQ